MPHVSDKYLANAEAHDCGYCRQGTVTSRRLTKLCPQSSPRHDLRSPIDPGDFYSDAMIKIGNTCPRTIDVEVCSGTRLRPAYRHKAMLEFDCGQSACIRPRLRGIYLVGPSGSRSLIGRGPLEARGVSLGRVVDVEFHRGSMVAVEAHSSGLGVGVGKLWCEAWVSVRHAVDRKLGSHLVSSTQVGQEGSDTEGNAILETWHQPEVVDRVSQSGSLAGSTTGGHLVALHRASSGPSDGL